MRKKLICTLPVLLVLSASLAVAFGDKSAIGKTASIKISKPLQVGSQVLERGTYRVKHVVPDDGRHFLRFKKGRTTIQVDCRVEPLRAKAKDTRYVLHKGALTELQIRGEIVRHIIGYSKH